VLSLTINLARAYMQPEYTIITQLLANNGITSSAAELHGLLTGLLCSGNVEAESGDIGLLLEPPLQLPPIVQQLLERFTATAQEQLSSIDYSFQPYLPSDDSKIVERVTALGAWCDGFTVGFAASYILPESKLGAEVSEILTDFAQFADVGENQSDLSEQDEADYMELMEYVRMATITVYLHVVGVEVAKTESEKLDEYPDDGFLH
jgi:uncharacterized protein YgfB (UPF0149 family)